MPSRPRTVPPNLPAAPECPDISRERKGRNRHGRPGGARRCRPPHRGRTSRSASWRRPATTDHAARGGLLEVTGIVTEPSAADIGANIEAGPVEEGRSQRGSRNWWHIGCCSGSRGDESNDPSSGDQKVSHNSPNISPETRLILSETGAIGCDLLVAIDQVRSSAPARRVLGSQGSSRWRPDSRRGHRCGRGRTAPVATAVPPWLRARYPTYPESASRPASGSPPGDGDRFTWVGTPDR
jgi:hypothetical protein